MESKFSKNNLLEIAYLFILCTVLLFVINGNMYNHKITHDMPYSYFATDAFAYLTLTEYVQDVGSQSYHPSHQTLGYSDVVWLHGIHLSAISVMVSNITNIPVYDVIFLILAFFIVLNCLLVYFLIRKHSIHLAILSSAFFVLISTKNFYITYLWGQGGAIPGMLFLTMLLWIATTKLFDNSIAAYSTIFSILILSHLPELIFGMVILIGMLAVDFLKNTEKESRKEIFSRLKVIIISLIISFVICSYYLISFYFGSYTTNVASQTGGLPFFSPVSTSTFPNIVLFSDLGTFLIVLLGIGILFSLYSLFIQKKLQPLQIALIILFILSFGNYFGTGSRAFHLRQFWPLYISIFIGLAIYLVYKQIMPKRNVLITIIISLMIIFSLYTSYYRPITGPGAITKEQYDAFKWIDANTPKEAQVYLLYGDGYSQSARIIKRNIYNMQIDDYATSLQTGQVRRDYQVEHMILGVGNLFYWKGFLKYGYHLDEYGGTTFIKPDMCSFDYYIIDQKSGYAPSLINLNLFLRNQFLNNSMVEVYNNNYVSILKNNNKGGNCIGASS